MSVVVIGLAAAAIVASVATTYMSERAEDKRLASSMEHEKEMSKNNSMWGSEDWEENNNVALQQYEDSIQTRKIEEGTSYENSAADAPPSGGGIYGPNTPS